jgi:hypothetical protein
MVLVGLIPGMTPRSPARNAVVAAGYVLIGVAIVVMAGGSGVVLPTDSIAGSSAAATTETATPTQTPTDTSSPAVKPRIETGVETAIEDGYARSVDDVQIRSQSDGYAVTVDYRLTPDRIATLRDLNNDKLHHHTTVAALAERLYTSDLPIGELRVEASVPVRQDGQRTEQTISTIVITRDTANDIRWGQFMPQTLPTVADSYSYETKPYR